jgi:MYXO-CTERM domain-containing protein
MTRWILTLALTMASTPALADVAPTPEKGGCKCSQGTESSSAGWAALGGVALAAGLSRRGAKKGER